MKFILTILFISSLSFEIFGQKTLTDIKPEHRAEINKFLSKNKDYKFLSETKINAEYLKVMREDFGKTFTPYYRVADFNNNKVLDFAMILSRKGKPLDQGKEISKEHRFRIKLAILVFNGKKDGGFEQAFLENIEVPYVCFLNLTEKKELYFGVYETDEAYMIKPFSSYRFEYFGEN